MARRCRRVRRRINRLKPEGLDVTLPASARCTAKGIRPLRSLPWCLSVTVPARSTLKSVAVTAQAISAAASFSPLPRAQPDFPLSDFAVWSITIVAMPSSFVTGMSVPAVHWVTSDARSSSSASAAKLLRCRVDHNRARVVLSREVGKFGTQQRWVESGQVGKVDVDEHLLDVIRPEPHGLQGLACCSLPAGFVVDPDRRPPGLLEGAHDEVPRDPGLALLGRTREPVEALGVEDAVDKDLKFGMPSRTLSWSGNRLRRRRPGGSSAAAACGSASDSVVVMPLPRGVLLAWRFRRADAVRDTSYLLPVQRRLAQPVVRSSECVLDLGGACALREERSSVACQFTVALALRNALRQPVAGRGDPVPPAASRRPIRGRRSDREYGLGQLG